MKALVCGGRDFKDQDHLWNVMGKALKWWNLTTIISGGAKGADFLAHKWAREHRLNSVVINADWDKFGKSAGIIRNRQMLELEPDVVIAFKGGTGTENMITISRKAGVPVFIV